MSATVQQPKFCPILPITTSPLTGKAAFTACQGPSCMFFLPVKDENSNVVGGSCCVTVLACEINQINAREEIKLNLQREMNEKSTEALEMAKSTMLNGLAGLAGRESKS